MTTVRERFSRRSAAATVQAVRMLHTMLRVRDLDASIAFYTQHLGMRLLRRQEFAEGHFTLAFLGYGPERDHTVLELTWNWDARTYERGTAYGHIALAVTNVHEAARALSASGVRLVRPAGPLAGSPTELIAFIEDPDGYRIELIEEQRGAGRA
jgi:lactoylglutathione lyase